MPVKGRRNIPSKGRRNGPNRALKVKSGAYKNPPDFMILLKQAVPGTENRQSTTVLNLNHAIVRGDKLTVELKKILT